MKAKERHDLKQNDFAATAASVFGTINEYRSQAALIGGGVLVVVAIAAGVFYWRKHTADEAGALFGIAQAIAQAQIAPASTLPGAGQRVGTYATVQERNEAALKAFQAVVDAYPSSDAATGAEYDVGSTLMTLGKFDEAAQAFKKVADAGESSIYKSMAQMGMAQTLVASGKYDDAIKSFTDLSAARDSTLPVDGVLMQLAETCLKAGKTADARAAFKRVVDEFPDSDFVSDAKQQMAALN